VELHTAYFKSQEAPATRRRSLRIREEERNNKTPKPGNSNTAGNAQIRRKTPGLRPVRLVLQNHAIMAAATVIHNRLRRRSDKLIQDFISKLYDFSNRKGPADGEPRFMTTN